MLSKCSECTSDCHVTAVRVLPESYPGPNNVWSPVWTLNLNAVRMQSDCQNACGMAIRNMFTASKHSKMQLEYLECTSDVGWLVWQQCIRHFAEIVSIRIDSIRFDICPTLTVVLQPRPYHHMSAGAAPRPVLAGPMPCHWKIGTWLWDLHDILIKYAGKV